jgi:hypothetical protein
VTSVSTWLATPTGPGSTCWPRDDGRDVVASMVIAAYDPARVRSAGSACCRAPSRAEAPQEQLRVGDSSDRRRAVTRIFGNVGLDFRPPDPVGRSDRSPRNGWGTGAHWCRGGCISSDTDDRRLAAFDARTGAESGGSTGRGSTGATPFVWEHPGRTEIVAPRRTI